MASHKLLTLADGWMKNDQLCISKNQKLQREAQFGQVKNAFEATHSDSRAKNVTFFCWQIHENRWKCIVIYLPNGLWEVQKSKLDAEGSQNVSAKTLIKPVIYCTFAQHVKKTMFSEFNDFPQMSKSLFVSPRAPVERPETLARAPWDHRMTSKWQQCMKNQWELTHFARLMSNRCQNHAKPKFLKFADVSPYM